MKSLKESSFFTVDHLAGRCVLQHYSDNWRKEALHKVLSRFRLRGSMQPCCIVGLLVIWNLYKGTVFHTYWMNSKVFTSKQKEHHKVRGGLQLGDVLLPLSVDSLRHHLQETLHQARLHQLQLYHIWRQRWENVKISEVWESTRARRSAAYHLHRIIIISCTASKARLINRRKLLNTKLVRLYPPSTITPLAVRYTEINSWWSQWSSQVLRRNGNTEMMQWCGAPVTPSVETKCFHHTELLGKHLDFIHLISRYSFYIQKNVLNHQELSYPTFYGAFEAQPQLFDIRKQRQTLKRQREIY